MWIKRIERRRVVAFPLQSPLSAVSGELHPNRTRQGRGHWALLASSSWSDLPGAFDQSSHSSSVAGPLPARGREGSPSLALRKRSNRDGCLEQGPRCALYMCHPHSCGYLIKVMP